MSHAKSSDKVTRPGLWWACYLPKQCHGHSHISEKPSGVVRRAQNNQGFK
jgi:hypothetical protein